MKMWSWAVLPLMTLSLFDVFAQLRSVCERVCLEGRLLTIEEWIADDQASKGALAVRGRAFWKTRMDEFGSERGFTPEEYRFLKATMDPDEFDKMWATQGVENEQILKELHATFARDFQKTLSDAEWEELISQYIRENFPKHGTRLLEVPEVLVALGATVSTDRVVALNQKLLAEEEAILRKELSELQSETSDFLCDDLAQHMVRELGQLEDGSVLQVPYPEPLFGPSPPRKR